MLATVELNRIFDQSHYTVYNISKLHNIRQEIAQFVGIVLINLT
jgi:hypothetical protein